MKLLKVIEGTCEFCKRDTEVCEVQMDNGKTAKLCFKDLQKIARMNLKEVPNAPRQERG